MELCYLLTMQVTVGRKFIYSGAGGRSLTQWEDVGLACMCKDLGLKPLSQEGGMEEEGRETHLLIDSDNYSQL